MPSGRRVCSKAHLPLPPKRPWTACPSQPHRTVEGCPLLPHETVRAAPVPTPRDRSWSAPFSPSGTVEDVPRSILGQVISETLLFRPRRIVQRVPRRAPWRIVEGVPRSILGQVISETPRVQPRGAVRGVPRRAPLEDRRRRTSSPALAMKTGLEEIPLGDLLANESVAAPNPEGSRGTLPRSASSAFESTLRRSAPKGLPEQYLAESRKTRQGDAAPKSGVLSKAVPVSSLGGLELPCSANPRGDHSSGAAHSTGEAFQGVPCSTRLVSGCSVAQIPKDHPDDAAFDRVGRPERASFALRGPKATRPLPSRRTVDASATPRPGASCEAVPYLAKGHPQRAESARQRRPSRRTQRQAQRPGAARCSSAVLRTAAQVRPPCAPPKDDTRQCALEPPKGPRVHIDRRPQRAFDRTFQAAIRTRRTKSLARRRSFRIPPKGTAQPTGFPKEAGLHKAPFRAVRCARSKRRSAQSMVQPTVTSWRWALAAEAAIASTPPHGVHRRNDGPSVEASVTRRRNGLCRLPQKRRSRQSSAKPVRRPPKR